MNPLRTTLSVLSLVALTQSALSAPAEEVKRTVVGYSSELSVRAGDKIDVMVSALKGGNYDADLVKVINGDSVSRYKDQFKVVPVDAPFKGSYSGKPQPLNLGSYIHVEDVSALDGLGSFTVAAWILPTFDITEYTPPDLDNIDPFMPPSLNIAELQQYQVIISASHPEYVTVGEFDAVAEYTQQGGRFIYAGGNGWFWSVAPMAAYPGALEIRNFHEIGERVLMNGTAGGLIVETGRKPGVVFGVEMAAMTWHGASPYTKLEDAKNPRIAWMFEGTKEGAVFGDCGVDAVHGGVAGYETDKYNPGNGVPRHALHLATAKDLRKTIENVRLSNMPLSVIYDPTEGENWAASDVVFFETPNGGAMLSTGSITWFGSTLENKFDNDVARISANAIRRFLEPTPFPAIDSAEVEDVDRAPTNPEYEHADQR